MNNLSIENLSRTIQSGDAQSLMGSSSSRIDRVGQDAAVTGGQGSGQGGTSFSDILKNSLEQVNQHQVQADQAIRELAAGRNKNIHETMLAVERADSSLKLMMQVRNKILDAYREIMRMQV
ncbi:MAG: flagellar hook-basal body complex protein FliE [Bdellovibrionales bacterium]|nr:flagellar hook-basal body complex protein FliE [Bdellovibrionales bacterium]